MTRRTVFMITGIGVHDPPESVFTIDWNLRSRSNEIRVHDPPESAAKIGAALRQTSARHLKSRIGARRIKIVAIRVAACDGENPFTQNIDDGMPDLGRIASIRKQRGQRVDHAKALVRTGKKKHSAIGTDWAAKRTNAATSGQRARAAIECGRDLFAANVW